MVSDLRFYQVRRQQPGAPRRAWQQVHRVQEQTPQAWGGSALSPGARAAPGLGPGSARGGRELAGGPGPPTCGAEPSRAERSAAGASRAGVSRYSPTRLSSFLGRSALWLPPGLCLQLRGAGRGRLEGAAAGEGGRGGRVLPFTSFPSSQPWLHPRRPERRGGWGAPDSGFPPGSCSGWWGRELATSRGSPGAGAARWALVAPRPPGWAWRDSAEGPKGARAQSAGLPAPRGLGVGSGLARGAAGKCGVASIAQPVRSGESRESVESGRPERDRHRVPDWLRGRGRVFWDLGCQSWGKDGEAGEGWSHGGGWGGEQRSSCGRDGCGLRSCHLESDRRRLL